MFLHAAEEGQEEAKRFICWGCWQSLPRLDPEADTPTIKFVGYLTSHKEIRDLYHNVYLLRRLPSPLPCRPQKREAIQNILSSLRSCLHRWGCTAMPDEDQWVADVGTPPPVCQWDSQSRSWRREDPQNEALWEATEAHQQALEATHMLEHNIERLSQGVEDAQYPYTHGSSSSCPQSKSLDRCKRSPSWHRLERWVTFWEPEVELDSSERHIEDPGDVLFEWLGRKWWGSPPAQRKEMVHPWEMPIAYWDVRGRGIICLSLQSGMLKYGWIGRPAN